MTDLPPLQERLRFAEFTLDQYDEAFYKGSPAKNPLNPAKTTEPCVVRGGSFFVEAFDLRSAARSAAWPSFQAHRMIGFRAVREP